MTEEQELKFKTTCYHEAAHAVFMWNFDRPVERVIVNRSNPSGYVMSGASLNRPCAVRNRIADILVDLAGGLAHRCFMIDVRQTDIRCSLPDIKMALDLIMTLGDIPPGAELWLLSFILKRTGELIDTPEIQSQVSALAVKLTQRGCLLTRQVHVLLKSLPESRQAKNRCRQAVTTIEAALPDLLEKATEAAANIKARSIYGELCEVMSGTYYREGQWTIGHFPECTDA
jgi:hypothetical protein